MTHLIYVMCMLVFQVMYSVALPCVKSDIVGVYVCRQIVFYVFDFITLDISF